MPSSPEFAGEEEHVTLEQVLSTRKLAFCYLDSGALLRYDVEREEVTLLSYTGVPISQHRGVRYSGALPTSGWRHDRDCACHACEASEFVVKSRARILDGASGERTVASADRGILNRNNDSR